MQLSAVVSTLAVGFTVIFAWPQAIRALRHGVEGVAPGAIVQSLVSASMWFGYGAARGLVEVMVADLGVITGQVLVTLLLVRAGRLGRTAAIAAAAASLALVLVAQVPALTAAVVAGGGLLGLSSAATQLLEVIREPDRLEGLSAGSFLLLTLLAASWLGYGMDRSDWAIIAPNIVMIPIAGTITVAAWRAHTGVVVPAVVDAELAP